MLLSLWLAQLSYKDRFVLIRLPDQKLDHICHQQCVVESINWKLSSNQQHCLCTRKHGKVLDSGPVGLPLRYFWNLIKQMSSFLIQTILQWACFWVLKAKQKGELEPWGVRNYSHIRYYFHNEMHSQFIHFHYANLWYLWTRDACLD